jgi:hypothetical protein
MANVQPEFMRPAALGVIGRFWPVAARLAALIQPLLVQEENAGALAICVFAAMVFIRVSSEKP